MTLAASAPPRDAITVQPSSLPETPFSEQELYYIEFIQGTKKSQTGFRLLPFLRDFYGHSFGGTALRYGILAWSAAYRSVHSSDNSTERHQIDSYEFISKFHHAAMNNINNNEIGEGHIFAFYFAVCYAKTVQLPGESNRITYRRYLRGLANVVQYLEDSKRFSSDKDLGQLNEAFRLVARTHTSSSDIPEFCHFKSRVDDAISFDSLTALHRIPYRSPPARSRSKDYSWRRLDIMGDSCLYETMALFQKVYFDEKTLDIRNWRQIHTRLEVVTRTLAKLENVISVRELFKMVRPILLAFSLT